MRNLMICFISILSFHQLQSQNIEGTVFDAKTKETIPGVAIYFSGTQIITTSDVNGKFRLVVDKQVHTPLILSHLSYEPLTIEKPFEHREKSFFLKEKVSMLAEVKVVADRYSRAEKMKVFKEQFLGKSTGGKSCEIMNEEDVVLEYNHHTYTLVGYAKKPVVIENRYLGYRITFDLNSFSVKYVSNTLDMVKAIKVSFKGTSSFIDLAPYNIQFIKRREEVHVRSNQFFWKNFVSNTLEKSKITIYNRYHKINPQDYFLISNAPPYKVVVVLPETNINMSHPDIHDGPIYGVIKIVSGKNYHSEVVFLTNRFSVDAFGNTDSIDNLIFNGVMGDQRLGDMLPRDYTLPKERP